MRATTVLRAGRHLEGGGSVEGCPPREAPMGDDDGPAGGADTRLFWMAERVNNALRLKPEKLKAFQGNADAR